MKEDTPQSRYEDTVMRNLEWLRNPVKPKCGMLEIPTFVDDRGRLTVADGQPFFSRRVFWVYGNEGDKERGNHSHEKCDQLLIALRGNIKATLVSKEGEERHFNLSEPNKGLYVPAGEFIKYIIEDKSILLVLCSEQYSENDVNKNPPPASK